MSELPPPPYSAAFATADLPQYAAVQAPHERVLLTSQPPAFDAIPQASSPLGNYEISTPSMSLNLGPRRYPTRHACYGRNAVINGVVTIKNFKHIKEASLTIWGRASVIATDRGFPIFQDRKVILFHSQVIWSSKKTDPRPTTPQTFPISFPLPTYAHRYGTILPPTTSAKYGNIEIDVRYSINLNVRKFGFYRHEYATSVFFYLPRSAPSSLRSLSNAFEEVEAKSGSSEEVEWRMVDARRNIPEAGEGTIIQLGLPTPLSYKSGSVVPWRVVIATPVHLTPELLRENVSVKIVKAVTIIFGSQRARMEKLIATGEIWKAASEDAEGESKGAGVWEVTGSIAAGRLGAEVSWHIGSFLEIRYLVKLEVKPMAGLPLYRRDELIQLVTDDSDDLIFEEARESPALGLINITMGSPSSD